MADDPSPDSPEESRFHRRGFFSQGFRRLLRPLAEIVEKRLEHLEIEEVEGESWERSSQSGAPARRSSSTIGSSPAGAFPPYPAGGVFSPESSAVYLRPPGARPEAEFLETCSACGRCVSACPVSAIKPRRTEDPREDGKPVIEASVQACVICDDLACMKACPTGALRLVDRLAIRMGRAVLRLETCVRSHGEDCQICVDKCPIGTSAIEIPFVGAQVTVKDGCTGCGVCEMYCPTAPKAIVVERV